MVLIFGTLAIVIGGLYWLSRATAERTIPSTPPDNAPAVGSCWQVDEATAKQALPWPGTAAECSGEHTIEMFQVGVDVEPPRKGNRNNDCGGQPNWPAMGLHVEC